MNEFANSNDLPEVDPQNMVPGKRYRIEFKDCCTEGFMVGTFIRWNFDADEPASDDRYRYTAWDFAVFDCGEIRDPCTAWELPALEPEPEECMCGTVCNIHFPMLTEG